MVESVGKKLSQARLQRGLTLDEAAHATKLRPDMISALETDDYGRFPSNAYAKGFLQIYGRFLKVEVSEFARTLDSTNQLSVSDYQYLSNSVPRPVERAPSISRERRRGPSLVPIFVFAAVVVLSIVGMQFYMVWQRLNPPNAPDAKAPAVAEGVVAPAAPIEQSPTPNTPAQPAPETAPAAAPSVNSTADSLSRDQSFLSTSDLPRADEIVLEPTRTTWVTVRTGSAKSAPVFEDFLYLGGRLKIKGTHFFVEARDPDAIQIRKNGAPIAYQANNAEVR